MYHGAHHTTPARIFVADRGFGDQSFKPRPPARQSGHPQQSDCSSLRLDVLGVNERDDAIERKRNVLGPSLDGPLVQRLVPAVGELGLRHVVITSVDRDDLPDGGAGQFYCERSKSGVGSRRSA